MNLFIDVGYISFKLCISMQKDEILDKLIGQDTKLCFDSDYNLRMHTYRWYKSNRGANLPPVTQALKIEAKKWQKQIKERYPSQSVEIYGLEGDDIVAMEIASCPEAYVMSQDHDFLQLECAYLVDYYMQPWSIARLKQKTLFLLQGERYLTYQLLHGCSTDTVPRTIFSRDRYTAPWCFAQPSPLRAALMLLPVELARRSLNCILLPTPLFTQTDPIEEALRRYPILESPIRTLEGSS